MRPHRSTRAHVVAKATVGLLLLAVPAAAHVTAEPGETNAGGYAMVTFRVPHGCDGSATTSVSVQIPDTVASVTPQFLPGWTVDTKTGPLAEPVELHGETVTEGAREVTWSGGEPIPDGVFFDFGISMLLPDDPGATLWFPTVQTCEDGETAWVEVPEEGEDAHELEAPAPSVTLTAAKESGHDHGTDEHAIEGHSEAASAEPVAGELAAASQEQGGSDGLAIVALVTGGVALLVGLAALLTARRRTS